MDSAVVLPEGTPSYEELVKFAEGVSGWILDGEKIPDGVDADDLPGRSEDGIYVMDIDEAYNTVRSIVHWAREVMGKEVD